MSNNDKYKKILILPAFVFVIYIAFDVFLEDFTEIDITGFGQVFLYFLVGSFILLGIICFANAFVVSEKGVNYNFNKIIGWIFIFFAIIYCSMGIYLRAIEENKARKLYEESVYSKSNEEIIKFLKKNPNAIEELKKQDTDVYKRAEDIMAEINKQPNTLFRYFLVFSTGMYIGVGVDEYDLGRSLYYIAYTIMTALSVYLGIFFIVNSKRNNMFEYENNLKMGVN